MRLLSLLAAAASLAACAPEEQADPKPPAHRAISTELESLPVNPGNRLPDPPPPPPPAQALPGLVPLSEAEVRAELGSGVSCSLVDGDRLLFVAIPSDAVVKDGGRILHLKPEANDWNTLVEGGRFESKDLIVQIDPGQVISRDDEVIVRSTDVDMKRGKRGFKVYHGPSWICGS